MRRSIRSPLIPFALDDRIKLKLENLQPFGSYKIRGIEYLLSQIPHERLREGVVAASAGNMGQALAYFARELKIPCTLIIPETAPAMKKSRMIALGAKLCELPMHEVWKILRGGGSGHGGYFIHPLDPLLFAGYAHIASELLDDDPEISEVLIPFGVGGLMIGVGSELKRLKPKLKLVAVEPACARPLSRLRLRDESYIPCGSRLMDAIGTPEVLPMARELLTSLVHSVVTVSESEVEQAMRELYQEHRLVVEGAGAASLAAAKRLGPGARTCILSGGNLDLKRFMGLFNEGI